MRFAHETGECANFACFAWLAPEEPNACASKLPTVARQCASRTRPGNARTLPASLGWLPRSQTLAPQSSKGMILAAESTRADERAPCCRASTAVEIWGGANALHAVAPQLTA